MTPVFVEGFPAPPHLRSVQREPGPPSRSSGSIANGELASAVREAAKTIDVDNVSVWVFDGDEGELRLVARLDRARQAIERNDRYGVELGASFRRALRSVTSLAIDDALRLEGRGEALSTWLRSEGIRAILATPVWLGESLQGFVSLEEVTAPHEWTPRERAVALRLASRVGMALEAGESLSMEPRSIDGRPGVDALEARLETNGGPGMSESSRLEDVPVDARPKRSARRGQRIRRMSRIEGAAVIHAEDSLRLLEALEVQDGYLRMLEGTFADRTGDVELLKAARAAGEVVRGGLQRFVRFVADGVRAAPARDLNRLLPEFIPAMAREIGDSGRLRIAPTSAPLPVAVEPGLLERALLHLVRNAREASSPDAVVRVSWAPVARDVRNGSEWEGARIRVEDAGEGIPAHDFPWLFEPFFSSRGDDQPLRGLGLSIVQAIVEGHGGWVEARSRQGAGTEVDLFLPLVVASLSATLEPPNGLDSAEAGASWRRRIVLLEGDPLLADLMDRLLSRAGYQVEVFATAVEAERRIRSDRPGVDLLIVSWNLPGGMSGPEFAESWRARRPDLPAILLRSTPAPDPDRRGSGLGWIAPPFDPNAIERMVDDLIARPDDPDRSGAAPAGAPH